MKPYRLAIFDLDGVIVDTAKYHYQAWKTLADKLGFEFTIEHNERLKGVSRRQSLEILLEVGKMEDKFSHEEKNAMAEAKNKWYVEYTSRLEKSELLPGALVLLKIMREKGIKTAIGSASKNAPLILERLGIAGLFDVIIDGNSTQKAKPDPEVFLLSAKALGIPNGECIVFEDAQAGIDAALAAGMAAIGVGNKESLVGAGLYVRDLQEFIDIEKGKYR